MSLTPELIAYLKNDELDFANIITIELPSGDICLSDYYRDIEFNGRTYGAGSVVNGISSIKETSDIKTGSISIALSGIGQDIGQLVLNGSYLNSPVTFQRVYFNANTDIVGAITLFFGRVSDAPISESNEEAVVNFECSSHFYDFERKSGRKTNSSSQQRLFPSDKGFEFAGTETQDIKWGRV
ncbi:MAG: baseplate hub domain-containing protein [Marinomonas sp.]|uniref:baseplate hub domain-containing protein n=1 Tax=Marinomonas sp. TaxID=1904862 RepID=UPI003F946133